MNIFDILGPVMVGPSSSHTAGAVRIGLITRKLLGCAPKTVTIGLHGSFGATGKGHGTDRALIAGLLNFEPDDMRIPESFLEAEKAGLSFSFAAVSLKDAHPNTALLDVTGENGNQICVEACSLGGGRILVKKLDGVAVNFTGEIPTLIVHNLDKPGHVAQVTSMLSAQNINIAEMRLYRDRRGGLAVMVIEMDHEVPEASIQSLMETEGILKVTYLNIHR